MNFVLDTNAVIYLQKGSLAEPLPVGRYYLSVITEIELLSFPGLSRDQEQALHAFLDDVTVVTVGDEIKNRAIRLRRRYRLKVPDAIIVATALSLPAELVSNDMKLATIEGLTCRSLALRPN